MRGAGRFFCSPDPAGGAAFQQIEMLDAEAFGSGVTMRGGGKPLPGWDRPLDRQLPAAGRSGRCRRTRALSASLD